MDRSLEEAGRALADRQALEAKFAGRRVRVVRAVTFEGPIAAVLRQIGASLPLGSRSYRDVTVDIAQGEIVDVGPLVEAPPVLTWTNMLGGTGQCSFPSDGRAFVERDADGGWWVYATDATGSVLTLPCPETGAREFVRPMNFDPFVLLEEAQKWVEDNIPARGGR